MWQHSTERTLFRDSQSCKTFKLETIEACSEYDKEIMKQTMLNHEEIFREQVCELHRLYQVQKLLMADLKRKDFNTSTFSLVTRQTGPFLFHVGSRHIEPEGKGNLWDAFGRPMKEKESRCHNHPITGMSYMQSPKHSLLGESVQNGLIGHETKDGLEEFYRPQPRRSPSMKFDLERPADEYMDYEATDRNEEDRVLRIAVKDNLKEYSLSNVHSTFEPESDVQLTLSIGWEKGAMDSDNQTGKCLGLVSRILKRKEENESKGQEEATFFPAASRRTKSATEETTGEQKLILSKQSLLGAHRGFGQEHQKYEDFGNAWQMSDVEHQGSRKRRQSLVLQDGERFIQENPRQSHGLLQNPQTVTIPPSNFLTQGFHWQQSSAFHQQRQVEGALNKLPFREHDARNIHSIEQRGMGHSCSKDTNCTGIFISPGNTISGTDSCLGLATRNALTPLTSSPWAVLIEPTKTSHGAMHSSQLPKQSSCHFPPEIHSLRQSSVSTVIGLPMPTFDCQTSFPRQLHSASGINGTNTRKHSSEGLVNWSHNGNPVQPGQDRLSIFHEGSLSSFENSLSQTKYAIKLSAQQQGASYPASTLTLSSAGDSLTTLQESCRLVWPALGSGRSPSQGSGGQNAEKDVLDSSSVYLKADKEVVATSGLKSRVMEKASKHESGYFHVVNRLEDGFEDHTGQVNTTNKGIHQESGHTNEGDSPRRASLTKSFMEFPYMKNPENNTQRKLGCEENIISSCLYEKTLPAPVPYRRSSNEMAPIHPFVDKLGDICRPLSRIEQLNLSLTSDWSWKDYDVLNGKKGLKPDASLGAQHGTLKPGYMEKKDINELLLSHSTVVHQTIDSSMELITTVQNCRKEHIHMHNVAAPAEHKIKMQTFQGSNDSLEKGQSAEVHETHKTIGFVIDDSKQTCSAEWQSMSPGYFQPQAVAAELEVVSNLQDKNIQDSGLNHKGIIMEMPRYTEIETRDTTGGCEGVVEEQSASQAFHVKTVTTKYYHGENSDKEVMENMEALAKSPFQIPTSDMESVKSSQSLECDQHSQKCSEDFLYHSGIEKVNMLQEDEMQNSFCMEEVHTKPDQHTEHATETIENKVQMPECEVDFEKCNKSINVQKGLRPNFQLQLDTSGMNEVEDPCCSAQLPALTGALGDSSGCIQIAAEALLSMASEKTSKCQDPSTGQPQLSPGLISPLEWFADMIPVDADEVEFPSPGLREQVGDVTLSSYSCYKVKEMGRPYFSDGLDYFEFMTLMLRENSVDGNCKPFIKHSEQSEKLSPLVSHGLRQLKRGKRARDFQKETLPSMSSLSRQEITEDLQVIGGLMRSAGDVCQTVFTRRSAGKNSWSKDFFIPLTGQRSRYLGSSQPSCGMPANLNSRHPKPSDHQVKSDYGFSWPNTWGETIRRKRMHRHRSPLPSIAVTSAPPVCTPSFSSARCFASLPSLSTWTPRAPTLRSLLFAHALALALCSQLSVRASHPLLPVCAPLPCPAAEIGQ
eukprot:Gb_29019 [translate_table: standard]